MRGKGKDYYIRNREKEKRQLIITFSSSVVVL